MRLLTELDIFTASYIEAALWSTNDESGVPLDRNHSPEDIAPATLEKMIADCEKFQAENAADLATYDHPQYCSEEMGGHDFWLTRNGHGAGFWDGDWEKAVGERLTKASKAFGEFDLYVGDNGKIDN